MKTSNGCTKCLTRSSFTSSTPTPPPPRIIVIQGMAKGPDIFARNWAKKNGHGTDDHPADWDTYGKRAGFLRNEKMINLRPDAAIFFWDGRSRGTLHSINLVKQRGIPHRVLPSNPT